MKPSRRDALLLGVCAGLSLSRRAGAERVASWAPAWRSHAQGALLGVSLEASLYERAGSPHFFVRVRLENRTAAPLGVDLSERWHALYPNQWGRGDERQRTVINERIAVATPLDAAAQARLREAFRRSALALLGPSGSLEYFAEFNASGRAEVERQAGRFVLVSMRGELRATDGARVEQLAFDDRHGLRTSDLVVEAPLRWGLVPPGARVL